MVSCEKRVFGMTWHFLLLFEHNTDMQGKSLTLQNLHSITLHCESFAIVMRIKLANFNQRRSRLNGDILPDLGMLQEAENKYCHNNELP